MDPNPAYQAQQAQAVAMMSQWQQEQYAQSLLQQQPASQTSVDLVNEHLQNLKKQFHYLDETVIYNSYFTEAKQNYEEAVMLLKTSFPNDPAVKVAAESTADLHQAHYEAPQVQVEEDSEMTPCSPEKKEPEPDLDEQQQNNPIEEAKSDGSFGIDDEGVPFLQRKDDNGDRDKPKEQDPSQNEMSENNIEPVKVLDCPFSINAQEIDKSMAESILENQPEGSEIGLLPDTNDEINCKTMHADIAKEIFLHLRLRLGDELKNQVKASTTFFEILDTLRKIFGNIVKNPIELKFRRLKTTNKLIQKVITAHEECSTLLIMMYFKEKQNVLTEEGLQSFFEVDQMDVLDNYQDFKEVVELIEQCLALRETLGMRQFLDFLSGKPMEEILAAQAEKARMENNSRPSTASGQMKMKLLEAQAQRQDRRQNNPDLLQQQREAMASGLKIAEYEDQLKHYRQARAQQYHWDRTQKQQLADSGFGRNAKVITGDDLQAAIDNDTRSRNAAYISQGGLTSSEEWGIRALDLTNKFRAATNEGHRGNLPPLAWNKALHDIALVHSKDMAEGKVPFGHQGFNERMRKVPFYVRSFSENVAWNHGCADPIEVAVRGWINSPGHRKNMLATNTICGIAVHCQGGRYWFTQLFALT